MNHVYDDYSRARIGFFFGLTGWQLTAVGLGVLPVLWATSRGDWTAAGAFLATWLALAAVVVTPIRGRSATGWLVARHRPRRRNPDRVDPIPRPAPHGAQPRTWTRSDLPGVLAGIEVHEAPPAGPDQRRVALIQNHTVRTWAVTAAVTHPGIGMERPGHPRPVRRRAGRPCSTRPPAPSWSTRSSSLVRTVPEDGAERDQWITRHRRPGAPTAARLINDDLQASLTGASVRTEAFVTVVVPESRIGREPRSPAEGSPDAPGSCSPDRRSGGAPARRARDERRDWLTSPELAAACRTGFAPGDRVGIIDALHAASHRRPASTPTCRGRWPARPGRTRRCGTTATTRGTRSRPPSSCPSRAP